MEVLYNIAQVSNLQTLQFPNSSLQVEKIYDVVETPIFSPLQIFVTVSLHF